MTGHRRAALPARDQTRPAQGRKIASSYYIEPRWPRAYLHLRPDQPRKARKARSGANIRNCSTGGGSWPTTRGRPSCSRCSSDGAKIWPAAEVAFSIRDRGVNAGYEIDGALFLKQHIPGEYLFRDTPGAVRQARRCRRLELRPSGADGHWATGPGRRRTGAAGPARRSSAPNGTIGVRGAAGLNGVPGGAEDRAGAMGVNLRRRWRRSCSRRAFPRQCTDCARAAFRGATRPGHRCALSYCGHGRHPTDSRKFAGVGRAGGAYRDPRAYADERGVRGAVASRGCGDTWCWKAPGFLADDPLRPEAMHDIGGFDERSLLGKRSPKALDASRGMGRKRRPVESGVTVPALSSNGWCRELAVDHQLFMMDGKARRSASRRSRGNPCFLLTDHIRCRKRPSPAWNGWARKLTLGSKDAVRLTNAWC